MADDGTAAPAERAGAAPEAAGDPAGWWACQFATLNGRTAVLVRDQGRFPWRLFVDGEEIPWPFRLKLHARSVANNLLAVTDPEAAALAWNTGYARRIGHALALVHRAGRRWRAVTLATRRHAIPFTAKDQAEAMTTAARSAAAMNELWG